MGEVRSQQGEEGSQQLPNQSEARDTVARPTHPSISPRIFTSDTSFIYVIPLILHFRLYLAWCINSIFSLVAIAQMSNYCDVYQLGNVTLSATIYNQTTLPYGKTVGFGRYDNYVAATGI